MCILNFTPHKINVFAMESVEFRPEIRKYVAIEGAQPVESIASSGMLSAKITSKQAGMLAGIPLFQKDVVGLDPLPEGNCQLIVSAIYAVAAKQMGVGEGRLLLIADPVFAADEQSVIGCMGLSMAL